MSKKCTTFAPDFKNREVAQLVSVRVWGARGRQFESGLPDHTDKSGVLDATLVLALYGKKMLTEKTLEKLRILAESAKYDVSCSSSGTVRGGKQGMVGNTVGGVGICHSFADDGRCISLLKVMLTNYCMYDCAYCINRRSNDIKRATLAVHE